MRAQSLYCFLVVCFSLCLNVRNKLKHNICKNCTKGALIIATSSKFQISPKKKNKIQLGLSRLPLLHQLQDGGYVADLSDLQSCHGTHLSSFYGFSFTPNRLIPSIVAHNVTPSSLTLAVLTIQILKQRNFNERRECYKGEMQTDGTNT